MDLIDGVSDLENFGIDLKLPSSEAEEFYCEALRIWFSTERGYKCVECTSKEFKIVASGMDLATIYIHDSVLRLKPIEKDPYEVLMCILEFIAENHKKVVETYEFLVDHESKWFIDKEDEKKLYRPKSKELNKTKEDYVGEEEDTEEDSDEWI